MRAQPNDIRNERASALAPSRAELNPPRAAVVMRQLWYLCELYDAPGAKER